jgi:probable phosphoglycerate mutase
VELVVVRHAEPVRIEDADGPADPPLTELGRAQAGAAARWLAAEHLDAVYASPLRRAVETAEPIAAEHGLGITIEDGVAEYDRESPHYIPYEELKAERTEHFLALVEGRFDEISPEGPAFVDRVIEAFAGLIASHPGQRIAVVCHGGTVNVFLAHVLGLDRPLFFEPEYTSISRVAASRNGPRSVVSINETGHLRDLAVP